MQDPMFSRWKGSEKQGGKPPTNLRLQAAESHKINDRLRDAKRPVSEVKD